MSDPVEYEEWEALKEAIRKDTERWIERWAVPIIRWLDRQLQRWPWLYRKLGE